MAWYLRVIELTGGCWACRRGRDEIDRHQSLDQALSHVMGMAEQLGPIEVIVHRSDGSVTRILPTEGS